MPQRILLLSPSDAISRQLLTILANASYPTTTADTLINPTTLNDNPALCLVDLAFCQTAGEANWLQWLKGCQATQTACLAFDSRGKPDPLQIARLDPLGDTIDDPTDAERLQSKLRSLLTIRKLSRQLDAARHQMSHYQESLQDALESAAHIQRSLIPKSRSRCHNLIFDWRYMPCKQVGGDLFNIVQLDEQTVMIYVVDVSGHGISSAMVTVSVHQSLSIHTGQLVKRPTEHPPFYEVTPPCKVLQRLEAEYPFERFEEFFTISYLLINPHTGELCYSNAGHPSPILQRHNGRIERLTAGGTIIGVGELVEFDEGNAQLQPGDRIFLYTDGITEHLAESNEPYGERRFLDSLAINQEKNLSQATREALIAMRAYGGSTLPIDDVTLIGIEFK